MALLDQINQAQAEDKSLRKYGLISEIPDAEIRPIERNLAQKALGAYGEMLDIPPVKFLLGNVGEGLQDLSYGMPMSDESKRDMMQLAMPLGVGKLAKVAKYATRGITPFNYPSTIKGLPSEVKVGGTIEEFGTDPRLVQIAEDYSKQSGIPYKSLTEYADVDVNRAKRIADAYENMKHTPNSPATKKAYDALIKETKEQYQALKKAGYKFDFMPDGADMYGNPRHAINDVVRKKHLYVFPTKSGFGSSDDIITDSPLLQSTGEKWNGKDVTVNDMFRAVHDVFGHSKHGVGFRAVGEENAFRSHAGMFSDDALPAMASETRGQNSWVNYGRHGNKNKTASPEDTVYADQKTGLLPRWAYTEGLLNL